jgi:uncharacterized protein YggE
VTYKIGGATMFKKILPLLVIGLLIAVPVFANEAPKTIVQVTGSSQREVTPDVAQISFSVSLLDPELEKAKNDNTQIVNRVMSAIKSQGVSEEQIKTDVYQVNPIYNYEKDQLPVLKGYRVTEKIDIRTSIDNVGVLVDEVTRAGANEINSIHFEAADETECKNQALAEAVQDALKKADVIAAALHKKVVRVTLVNESGVSYQPVVLETRLLKSAAGNVPNISAGKVTVNANVQVTVELE